MIVCNTPIMAQPLEILERLKQETELLDTIKEAGNNVMFTCPFHAEGHEHKPSCGISQVEVTRHGNVYPEGTVHCFTCGYSATLELFVSNILGYNDGGLYGYKWLIQNYVSIAYEKREPMHLDMKRNKEIQEPTAFISEKVLQENRFTHPYMYKRKLTGRSINYFDIGFEKETNCITFPVKDLEGKVVFFYRRSVNSKFFVNIIDTPRGEYLYGLFQAYQNMDKFICKELWICESPIDAITAWQHGKLCVAAFTTSITEIQIELLKQFPFRKLVIATDNDQAGDLAYKKIYKALKSFKLIERLSFPKDRKDLNEFNDEEWESL